MSTATRPPRAHVFDGSTGGAYDTSQCDDSITNGDVLVVPSEGVVGIMLEAWPTAVTEATGAFHSLAMKEGETPDSRWANMTQTFGPPKDYSASLYMARTFAAAVTAYNEKA